MPPPSFPLALCLKPHLAHLLLLPQKSPQRQSPSNRLRLAPMQDNAHPAETDLDNNRMASPHPRIRSILKAKVKKVEKVEKVNWK